ncbi:hypothetical protein JTE90_009675 [Oedothorax gibbosus]|uniref:Exonuclease domain-containing protein n=1 Tax=Oedothorax gibbosus TaxID=931172 RepID=A0AAV6TE14_9ARAC|nr:hypothetical protein JTE90_009675 [Oedothorax gibbosus]
MDKFYAERRVYVNPQRDVTPQAYRVHGISRDFLKSKPLFANIVREFLTFVGNSPMVMHNAPFDVKFLNHELAFTETRSAQEQPSCRHARHGQAKVSESTQQPGRAV